MPLPLPLYVTIGLNDKVEAWRQEVHTQTSEPAETDTEACRPRSSHGITLRPSTSHIAKSHPQRIRKRRSALAEIPHPNHSPNSKAPHQPSISKNPRQRYTKGAPKVKMPPKFNPPMSSPLKPSPSKPSPSKPTSSKGKGKGPAIDDDYISDEEDELAPSPRVRRPNPSAQQHMMQREMTTLKLNDDPSREGYPSQSSQASPSRPASSSHQTSQSRGTSSQKPPSTPKNVKNMDDKYKSEQVVLEFLEKSNPPVSVRKIEQVRARYGQVPQDVLELYNLLDEAPIGNTIPSTLQTSYEADANTPRGSKHRPRGRDYSSPAQDPWPQEYHQYLKNFINNVMQKAADSETGHECQWEDVVFRIANVFELWPEAEMVQSINVRTIQFEPAQICPVLPNGPFTLEPAKPSDQEASSAASSRSGKDLYLKRQVDRVMALKIADDERYRLNRAFAPNPHPYLHSVNQTHGSTSLIPFWLNIEIKRWFQPVDPRIQLAIWTAAGFLKRQLMAWDLKFPVPGITVEGHVWRLYVFFWLDGEITMMGPVIIGSTETLSQTWQLIRSMYLLVRWGSTKYRKWFEDNILKWADQTRRAAGSAAGPSARGF
ncbi:MAG: hypothetical protein Q9219_005312 [cf. Caloplaca sp. 3 TL-2023]